MQEASLSLIIKHLCHLPEFFNNTLNQRTVASGFRQIGLWPPNTKKMISRCDTFSKFTPDEQDKIVAAIPLLAAQIPIKGTTTDSMIDSLLPFLPPPPQEKNSKKKDNRAVHQRRSLLFLDESYQTWRAVEDAKRARLEKEMKERAEEKAMMKEKKRQEKEKEKEDRRKEKEHKAEERTRKEKQKKLEREKDKDEREKKRRHEAEEKRKKKEDRAWLKLVQKAHTISLQPKRELDDDDWTCFLCYTSMNVWLELGMTTEANARNEWYQGNHCEHAFCPACATENIVDRHSTSCSRINKKRS